MDLTIPLKNWDRTPGPAVYDLVSMASALTWIMTQTNVCRVYVVAKSMTAPLAGRGRMQTALIGNMNVI